MPCKDGVFNDGKAYVYIPRIRWFRPPNIRLFGIWIFGWAYRCEQIFVYSDIFEVSL